MPASGVVRILVPTKEATVIWAAGLELETHDNPLSIDYPRRLREGAEHA